MKKATVIIFIIFSLYISVLAEINFTVSPETGFIDKIYIEGTEAALFDSHSIVIAGETLKLSETEKSENTVYVKMVSDNFEMLTKYTLSDNKILIDSSVKNTSDSKKLVKLSDVFDYNSFFPLISTSKLIDKPGLVHQTEDGALIYYSDEIFRTFNAMNKAVLMAKYTNLDSQSSFDYKRTIYAGKILNSVLKKYMDENSVEYKTYSSTLTFRNGRSTKNTKVYLTDFNGNVYNYLKITENDGEFNFYYPDGQYYFIPYTGYQHYENFNFVSENEIDLPENYIVYEPFLTNVTGAQKLAGSRSLGDLGITAEKQYDINFNAVDAVGLNSNKTVSVVYDKTNPDFEARTSGGTVLNSGALNTLGTDTVTVIIDYTENYLDGTNIAVNFNGGNMAYTHNVNAKEIIINNVSLSDTVTRSLTVTLTDKAGNSDSKSYDLIK